MTCAETQRAKLGYSTNVEHSYACIFYIPLAFFFDISGCTSSSEGRFVPFAFALSLLSTAVWSISISSSSSPPLSSPATNPFHLLSSPPGPSPQVHIGKATLSLVFRCRLCTFSQPPFNFSIIAGRAFCRLASACATDCAVVAILIDLSDS